MLWEGEQDAPRARRFASVRGGSGPIGGVRVEGGVGSRAGEGPALTAPWPVPRGSLAAESWPAVGRELGKRKSRASPSMRYFQVESRMLAEHGEVLPHGEAVGHVDRGFEVCGGAPDRDRGPSHPNTALPEVADGTGRCDSRGLAGALPREELRRARLAVEADPVDGEAGLEIAQGRGRRWGPASMKRRTGKRGREEIGDHGLRKTPRSRRWRPMEPSGREPIVVPMWRPSAEIGRDARRLKLDTCSDAMAAIAGQTAPWLGSTRLGFRGSSALPFLIAASAR